MMMTVTMMQCLLSCSSQQAPAGTCQPPCPDEQITRRSVSSHSAKIKMWEDAQPRCFLLEAKVVELGKLCQLCGEWGCCICFFSPIPQHLWDEGTIKIMSFLIVRPPNVPGYLGWKQHVGIQEAQGWKGGDCWPIMLLDEWWRHMAPLAQTPIFFSYLLIKISVWAIWQSGTPLCVLISYQNISHQHVKSTQIWRGRVVHKQIWIWLWIADKKISRTNLFQRI